MAAVALQGELKYRDGLKKKLHVNIENNLSSMVAGIKTFNEDVSELLTELVEQEKRFSSGDNGASEDDEEDGDEDEDDSDEDDSDEEQHLVSEPPAKRSKALKM